MHRVKAHLPWNAFCFFVYMNWHILQKNIYIAATLAVTTAPILWVVSNMFLCPASPYCDVLFSAYTFVAALAVSSIGFYYYIKFNKYSIKDLSTGAYTKNYFFDVASQEMDKSKRYDDTVTIAIFSLDDFEEAIKNNNLSHEAMIQMICKDIISSIRASDVLSTLGDEEFAILLPHTSAEGARTLAYRLTKIILDRYSHKGIRHFLEVSFGLSDFKKSKRDTVQKVYEAASIAHSAAKESVRNKIIAYGDPGMFAS